MTLLANGNWSKEMTLLQPGRYTFTYAVYRNNTCFNYTPTPNYVDNTVVNMSGATKKIVWPFGADGSSWNDKNPSSGVGAWYITCGPGQGTYTGTESQAQDWARNSCQGATIKSPLDGIVFKKEQYHGGNIIGIQQTVGTTEYKLSINHLDSYATGISVGSYVKAGVTVIGYVGQTGNATGPHAHIHIKVNSNSVPFDFLCYAL
ncbi:MAG: M23 family metallopeptidase [Candidatus Peribacteria bacterium]|jgi:murein DD-endopeptidase MepM/ murein hydrolase activator NlpD|nr:M23 family metallopeptidase [Candidatus Peribacteria bacterium]